jgi:hypothetical protein
MSDYIVDEVRRIREERAARFNYDMDAMFRDIKEQERTSGLTYVSYVVPRTEPKRSDDAPATDDANRLVDRKLEETL